jgi:hypothetical protein
VFSDLDEYSLGILLEETSLQGGDQNLLGLFNDVGVVVVFSLDFNPFFILEYLVVVHLRDGFNQHVSEFLFVFFFLWFFSL